MPEDCAAIQTFQGWRNDLIATLQLNRKQCKVLDLRRNTVWHTKSMMDIILLNYFTGKAIGDQICAWKQQCVHRTKKASRTFLEVGYCHQVRGGGSSTLVSAGESTPRIFCQVLISPVQERLVATRVHAIKGHKDDLGAQEQFLCRRAVRTKNVHPGAEKNQDDVINLCKHIRYQCKEIRARLFSVAPSDMTRDNGHKLKHRYFHLNTPGTFFLLSK